MVGLGLYQRPWMGIEWPADPSVGNIEAEVFDPATWKTEYPNPAFQQLDAADAFWAASIIARFTDTMVRAVVEEARLSNPDAAAYLADIIIKRRDKTVRWGITATNPVDRFTIAPGPAPALAFDNLAARLGLAAGELRYHRPLGAVRQPDRHAAGRARPGRPSACGRRFPPTSGGRRIRPASGMPSRPFRR